MTVGELGANLVYLNKCSISEKDEILYILKHIEVCKGVAGGVRVDELGEVHHQLLLGVHLGREPKSRRFWVFDLSEPIVMDILHPSLNLPIFGEGLV